MPESARGVLDSKDLSCPPVTNLKRCSRLGQGTIEDNKLNYINFSEDSELIDNFNKNYTLSSFLKSEVLNIFISDC
jgi:hypothetical protein